MSSSSALAALPSDVTAYLGKCRGTPKRVRDRLDTACGGIGKRRLRRIADKWLPRKGKRRQTAGKAVEDEGVSAGLDEFEQGAPEMPEYADVPYTRREQESPGRQRGRRTLVGRLGKDGRGPSLFCLLHGSEEELFEYCCEAGFLKDRRKEPCPRCGEVALRLGTTGRATGYACNRACRYRESLTEREPGFFLPRVPLSKQMLVVYLFINHNQPGTDQLAYDADMHREGVTRLIDNIRQVATWRMIRANWVLQVGGRDEGVEADEVSFRSIHVEQDGEHKVVWARFLGVARRGSSLCYWGELETRITKAAQGGGGKLGTAELEHHMLHGGEDAGYKSRPLLCPGSVLHTDAASSYAQIHRLRGDEHYKQLGVWVTQVRHSRKKGEDGQWLPVQFTVRKKVQLLSGAWVWRKGGTQNKDGFWALIRRHVSRRAVPSCNSKVLRQMAYFFQWLYWRSTDPIGDAMRGRHAGLPATDMLSAMGGLRRNLRDLIGDDRLREAGDDWFEAVVNERVDALPPVRTRLTRKTKAS